ncbi:MAG: alpha/beta hydrolase [Lachnospiraceae bacterium]|nr:alpha/beta hydrolase [Lachnospiraceae bacterium]
MTYLTFGSGTKPLVMIPGLRLSGISGGAKAVAWYYRIFAKEYRVFLFDRKDPVTDPCTIHDLAEDVSVAMQSLGLREAHVFGASQGGMIAQDLAIHHPELVSKLALGVTLSRNNETVEQVVRHWIELSETKGLSAVAEDYFEKGYSEAYLRKYKAFLPLLMKTQKLMPKERFIALAKACLTCDTYDRLTEIRCPVLVLGGGKDRIVTGEASLEIAEKLGCEVHMYEELSHEAYNEAKDFNRRIYEFLNR